MDTDTPDRPKLAILPDYWPDQIPGSVGGARRRLSYRAICSLQECPRQERVIAWYTSNTAAYQAALRVKKNDYKMLPPGVWHFYARDVHRISQDKIQFALLGVYFGPTDDEPVLLFPITRNLPLQQLQKLADWQEAVGTDWMKIEDQFNQGIVREDKL